MSKNNEHDRPIMGSGGRVRPKARLYQSQRVRCINPPKLSSSSLFTQGMPCQKIALGLATYGRAFKLRDPNSNGLAAPTSGKPTPGKYTREAGFLSYYEICTMELMVVQDSEVKAPYGYKGGEWVGYDDQNSLTLKVNSLIKEKNLLGAMFWALDLDDFKGTFCGQGR